MITFSLRSNLLLSAALALTLVGPLATICPAHADDMNATTANDTTTAGVAPDNTKNNQGQQLTAQQASPQLSDLDVMSRIRRSVVADKSLSTYGHNVKIIAHNGKVTLKGPVRSEAEVQNILVKATSVAGEGNVVNNLSVKQSSY